MTKLHISPCLGASVVFLFALIASAQQPAEVCVDKEPHHHLVFENEYVRVFKVELASHESTLVHRHTRDYVVVTIGDAEVTNAVVGKEPKRWSFADGDVRFLEASGEKSYTHKAMNEGEKPFVNLTVEFKKSPGVNKCKAGTMNCDDRMVFAGEHYEVSKSDSASTTFHDFSNPRLLIAVDDLNFRVRTLDPEHRRKVRLKRGDLRWLEWRVDYAEFRSTHKSKYVMIECN